jgi:hypothetical protein
VSLAGGLARILGLNILDVKHIANLPSRDESLERLALLRNQAYELFVASFCGRIFWFSRKKLFGS